MSHSYAFPTDFAWGVATASYQIEGAHDVDGRAPSVWDTWSRTPGATTTGETGDIACDHYHRFEGDLDLMRSLGIRHYRLSVAWPRILPGGTGTVNEKGLDFYDRLIDACLKRGITPYLTCFHWDLPQALQDRYLGWQSRQCAHDFADYCAILARRYGDRVTHWMTANEIPCFTTLGHGVGARNPGMHAPGAIVANRKQFWQTTVHAILAHGLGVRALRANAPRAIRVGLADCFGPCIPFAETPEHIAAAQRGMQDTWCTGAVTWPILTGRYSEDFLANRAAENAMPDYTDADLKTASAPLDFVGLNIYSGNYYRASQAAARETTTAVGGAVSRAATSGKGFEMLALPEGYPRLDMPWLNIVPDALYWACRHIRDTLGFRGDLYITENGTAARDSINAQGEIVDLDRILYLKTYLRALHRAIGEGMPVKGYFQWSFLDNFEWAWGYSKRFGLVFTEYQSQRRIPKLSASYYREVIAANAVV